MSHYNQQTDPLKSLFGQLQEEQLPASFRSSVMQQIMAEAVRVKKRNERLAWLAIAIASLVMIAMAVLVVIYLDVPKMVIELPSLSSVSFYLYIGILSLLLLFADYKFRKAYRQKHEK